MNSIQTKFRLKTTRSGLFSESGETVRAEKTSFNCIRSGSERAGAIMAGRAGSDYHTEVKGLVDAGGPQGVDRRI